MLEPEQFAEPAWEPPRPRAWGYLDLFYLVLFAAVALFFSFVVCLAAFEGGKRLLGIEAALDEPPFQMLVVIAVQFLWWAFVLGFIYYTIVVKYGLEFWSSLGYVGYRVPAVNFVMGGMLTAFSVGMIAHFLPMPKEKLPLEELLADPLSVAVFVAFGVTLGPIIEELVFRGFLFSPIRRAHGAAAAVVATSAVFSLLHAQQYGGNWQNVALLFYVGCVLGAVRAATGSLIPSTILHACYNATLLGALIFGGEAVRSV